MVRLIDILKEGTLQLSPEERNQVEKMIPRIIEIISGKYLGDNQGIAVGFIDYTFADKTPGKVVIVVGNDMSYENANGYFQTNDPKNPTDNKIWIQQFKFQPFFNIIGKTYSTLTGDKNQGIELLRKTLKHELIHAKDPALNQHYLKEPYDLSDSKIYYKSWAEFQSMTGQFFEAITTGVDRILMQDSSKENIKKLEKVLKNILNFYSGKITITGKEALSQDTIDFIQGTGKRNIFQSLIKFAENTLSTITGVGIMNALDAYISYIEQIKKYNPEGYREFLTDLYKTIDTAKDKINITLGTNIKIREMHYINEAKRFQQLAGIITEAEQVEVVADKVEDGLEAFKSQLQSFAQSAKPSPQDGKIDEAILTLAATVAGAPGLLSLLGKGADMIAKGLTLGKVDKTIVGQALQKAGHKLEDIYIGLIGDALKASYPTLYQGQDTTDNSSELYKKAHGIYAAILAAAAIASGVAANNATGLITKALEGGMAVFKAGEVVQLAQKIAAA